MSNRRTQDPFDAGSQLTQGRGTPIPIGIGQRRTTDARRTLIIPAGGTAGVPTPGGGGAPTIALGRLTAAFSGQQGAADPAPQTISLTNSGTGTLAFQVGFSAPIGWLSVTPGAGIAPATLTLRANTGGQAPGTYTVNVVISSEGAANTPQTIVVTLTVTAPSPQPPVPPAPEPPPPVPPPGSPVTVAPINRHLWLGYFKADGRDGNFVTRATSGAGNCAVILADGSDFSSTQDAVALTAVDAATLRSLGAAIIIQGTEAGILAAKPYWDIVAAIFVAVEGFPGVTYADQAEGLERAVRTLHSRIWAEQLPNRPILCYIGGPSFTQPGFYVPDGVDWVGVEAYGTYPTSRQAMESLIQTRLAILDAQGSTHPRTIIAQAYDRNADPGWSTHPDAIADLQGAFANVARAQGLVNGILYFAYGRAGGTLNYETYLRPWHEAIFRACLPGRPPIEAPSFPAQGFVNGADCIQFSGWAFDPDNPDLPIIVQIFDRPRRSPGAVRIAQLAANQPRPDVVATTRDGGNHGWSLTTPVTLKDGLARGCWIYGVSATPTYGGFVQVPLGGTPNAITCAPGTGGSPPPAPGPTPAPSPGAATALPQAIKDLGGRMATQFPVPQQGAGEPLATFQQRARDWCRMFAEQIKFEFPNDGYGVKSSSPSNPQSKDTVARLVGGHLFIWDIFIAVDTGHPTLNLNALSQDITGQNFIPVTAHNWLSAPAPPGPPPAGAPDKLSADDRGFKHGSGRFDWKCATSFQMLQRVVASGIGSVTGDLDALAGLGVTSIRVLGMASNLFSLTPSAVNYFPSLVALADALQTRNMAMEFTVFADAQLVAPSQAGRLDHVKNVANQLLARPNVIVEIANEPWNNGITSYGDLIALANAYRAIDSRRALALGSDQNDKSLAAAVPPTNYIAFHGSRLGGREWAYRYMDGDHLPITQTARVPYDNEPINAGDGRIGQIDGNPAHWLFAAGVSRARRFQLTFHFPEGRFSKRPDQGSQNLRDCFNAWKAGLDAIPFDSGGSYVSTFHAQDARCPITGAAAGGIIRLSGRFDGTRGWAVLSGTAPLLPAIISGWTATLITSRGGGDDMTAIYFVAVTGSGGPGTPPDPPPPPIGGGSGGGNPPPRV